MALLDLKNKVFVDKRNRNIYYNVRTKEAHVIPDKNLRGFNIFYKRFFISVLIAVALWIFTDIPEVLSILAGVIVFVGLELILRKVILPSYTTIANYDLTKNRQPLKQNDPQIGKLMGLMLAAIVFIISVLFFKLPNDQMFFLIGVGVYIFIDALYSLMDKTQS